MNFSELYINQLWQLRQEVVLSRHKVNDYTNSFGFNPSAIHHFFEEYLLFIHELMEDVNGFTYRFGCEEWWLAFEDFDTKDNLQEYFDSYDDFNWMNKFS